MDTHTALACLQPTCDGSLDILPGWWAVEAPEAPNGPPMRLRGALTCPECGRRATVAAQLPALWRGIRRHQFTPDPEVRKENLLSTADPRLHHGPLAGWNASAGELGGNPKLDGSADRS